MRGWGVYGLCGIVGRFWDMGLRDIQREGYRKHGELHCFGLRIELQ